MHLSVKHAYTNLTRGNNRYCLSVRADSRGLKISIRQTNSSVPDITAVDRTMSCDTVRDVATRAHITLFACKQAKGDQLFFSKDSNIKIKKITNKKFV